ncbi:AraC family transcriptional regulator [Persicobacter psychrovividus]|uniref:HTH araC/xylS-type domain-containing protein n=1 Tax=Persicobacter psychrovividus TaxID=387638 RepID=A0ABN6LFF9_9BACT|nr:hypothetical protein PEPS_41950 [Persicobacter psychrovividus]
MLHLKITKTENLLQELADQVGGEILEGTFKIPSQLGTGSIQLSSLVEGVILHYGDFCINDDLMISRKIEEDINKKFFSIIYSFESHDITESIENKSQEGIQNHILFLNRYFSYSTFAPAYRRNRHVQFFISIEKMQKIVQYYDLPLALNELLNSTAPWCYKYPFSMEVQKVLFQMNNYKINNQFTKGYVINKCEELIMLMLENLYLDQMAKDQHSHFIHQDDLKLIIEAEQRLMDMAFEDISIKNLAEDLSVGIRKLQRLFKAYHGVDMTTYRKHIRMEQSRQMIAQQSLSITEICYKMGYSSVSHFSKIFKDHFGVSPSSLIKK